MSMTRLSFRVELIFTALRLISSKRIGEIEKQMPEDLKKICEAMENCPIFLSKINHNISLLLIQQICSVFIIII